MERDTRRALRRVIRGMENEVEGLADWSHNEGVYDGNKTDLPGPVAGAVRDALRNFDTGIAVLTAAAAREES